MADFLPNQVCKDVLFYPPKIICLEKCQTKWIFEHHSCGHLNAAFYEEICLNSSKIIENIFNNNYFNVYRLMNYPFQYLIQIVSNHRKACSLSSNQHLD